MEANMIAQKLAGVVILDAQSDPLEAGLALLTNGALDLVGSQDLLPPDPATSTADPQAVFLAPEVAQFQEDPAWVKGMDIANQLQSLELADSDPSNSGQIYQALERLGEHLNAMLPLDAMLRERRILDILRTKRIKRGVALIKAARRQAKMKKKVRIEPLDAVNDPG
jgi:hypothetical protein